MKELEEVSREEGSLGGPAQTAAAAAATQDWISRSGWTDGRMDGWTDGRMDGSTEAIQ